MRKRKAGKAYFEWLGALDSNPQVLRPVFKHEYKAWPSHAQWAYVKGTRQTSMQHYRPAPDPSWRHARHQQIQWEADRALQYRSHYLFYL